MFIIEPSNDAFNKNIKNSDNLFFSKNSSMLPCFQYQKTVKSGQGFLTVSSYEALSNFGHFDASYFSGWSVLVKKTKMYNQKEKKNPYKKRVDPQEKKKRKRRIILSFCRFFFFF